jgi:hypothetical protein
MTSREEEKHVVLKRQLESSTKNLKTVMNEINLLFINEHHKHVLALADEKIKFSTALRKFVFNQLKAHITHYAIRKIVTQYDLLIEKFIVIDLCIRTFIIIIELSCNHKIQNRLFNEESLLLKNVHSH